MTTFFFVNNVVPSKQTRFKMKRYNVVQTPNLRVIYLTSILRKNWKQPLRQMLALILKYWTPCQSQARNLSEPNPIYYSSIPLAAFSISVKQGLFKFGSWICNYIQDRGHISLENHPINQRIKPPFHTVRIWKTLE